MMGGGRIEFANVTLFSPAAGVVSTGSPTSWSIAAIFQHFWTPTLQSNLAASYVSVTPDSTTAATDWYLRGGWGKSTAWTVAGNLIWTPTSGFDIGMEVGYRKVNNGLSSVGPAWGTAGAPNTIGVAQNPSMVFGRLRVDRRF